MRDRERRPQNLLIVMADEHSPRALGCAGHAHVRTPHLDALAARGTRFAAAYTASPICVPARAALATGRYVHETGHWDNAMPYRGAPASWGHRLQAAGRRVVSIGKLHYRNADDPTGFDEQIEPMHVVDGVGDVLGCVRDELPIRRKGARLAQEIGPGDSAYIRYDRRTLDAARRWLAEEAPKHRERPWALFVSFVCPHYPLIAPPEFYAHYADVDVPLPKAHPSKGHARHPWIEALARCQNQEPHFDTLKRATAIASYWGLCSFVDANVGALLAALGEAGHAADTRVLYLSDHGEHEGSRGLWGKSTLYEESVGIPMILAGEGVPAGRVCGTPVSLVDVFPTVLDATGVVPAAEDASLPGRSLFGVAAVPDDRDRAVFAEYHAMGAATGAFMLRRGRWKYVHYVGMAPQLFDLAADPEEMRDLGSDPRHAFTRAALEGALRGICDPDAVDARARAAQAALIAAHGGREAVVAKGGFGGTPAPGETATYG